MANSTLCILGCGNLGTSILTSLLNAPPATTEENALPFTRYIACVRSAASSQRLAQRFSQNSTNLTVERDPVAAVTAADVVILGIDPADIQHALSQPALAQALKSKLLVSVAAGWTTSQLHETLGDSTRQMRIVRTLPNIAAQVSESLTAIEVSPSFSSSKENEETLGLVERIFNRVGKMIRVGPSQIDAITAVGGSTPAFFAIICDALIDAAVATGVPRDVAGMTVVQAMKGSAAMMQEGGLSPAELRDQGTSPAGCTMAGVMALEEGSLRGVLGRGMREAVERARGMGDRD
ncbi:pyrroline-5-carboxylate reductase family protein [Aspergillus affinis]|uniref:pyrroline-5-carboxylate reductase family protein n=1 Tax=Aspergillus affinis TaxID=1070780 RepID=UPI0022FE7A9C|nr:putative pyrroline-5-carboxylate dehydrogenase [Aspergillus affinis]KAI9044269.1 putative pyrroline-5-carboxylate dehydrogenase [Aspergillus affinis]